MLRDDTAHEERIGSRDLAAWSTPVGRAVARAGLALGHGAVRVGTWSAANVVLIVTALVGGLAVVALTALTAEVYESVVEADGLAGLDHPVLDAAIGWRNPGLDHAVTLYTDVGGPVGMPVLAALATAVMVWRWRSRTPLVLMVIAALGSLAMTITGKQLIGRARPPQSLAVPPFETSPSFPSGHTLNATVLTGIVVYLLLRRLESARARTATVVAGVLFVGSMGLSRVFLGHHWLTDVVAGWALGLAWVAVVVTAHRLYLTVRRATPGHAGTSATQWSPSGRNPSRS
ncbi:phosphatase PAP2 family protein [Phycicoccus sp. Root101]|uniref:phosphatase PAP2 family protein n=1 Tax=Phycicoccus sp. Root101 TaxID=1736421 RepID=UPI0009ECB764|nr:phosphatase PAP2 family protein [Phycicoccus sp. Root101]